MYGIFTYIYHKNQPNVGKYTIHGWYHHDIPIIVRPYLFNLSPASTWTWDATWNSSWLNLLTLQPLVWLQEPCASSSGPLFRPGNPFPRNPTAIQVMSDEWWVVRGVAAAVVVVVVAAGVVVAGVVVVVAAGVVVVVVVVAAGVVVVVAAAGAVVAVVVVAAGVVVVAAGVVVAVVAAGVVVVVVVVIVVVVLVVVVVVAVVVAVVVIVVQKEVERWVLQSDYPMYPMTQWMTIQKTLAWHSTIMAQTTLATEYLTYPSRK